MSMIPRISPVLKILKRGAQTIAQRLVQLIELQLFLTVLSLPLLLPYNFPLSPATVVGNILFTPLITGMLFFGFLLFCAEILALPTNYLWHLFQQGTTVLELLFTYLPTPPQYYLPPVSFTHLFLFWGTLVIGALMLFQTKLLIKTTLLRQRLYKVILFSMYCTIALILIIKQSNYQKKIITLTYQGLPAFTCIIKGTTIVMGIDHGVFSRISTLEHFLKHKLTPVIRHYGQESIFTTLVLLKPTRAALTLAKTVMRHPKSTLILPLCNNPTPTLKKLLHELTNWATVHHHKIVSPNITSALYTTPELKITLFITGILQTGKHSYHDYYTITGICSDQEFTLKPVLTAREQVLPLPPQSLMVNK